MYQDNSINQTSWEIRQEKHKKWVKSLWIFFGIHTANAKEIGRRIYKNQTQIAA